MFTPQYPQGRDVVIIANDITHQVRPLRVHLCVRLCAPVYVATRMTYVGGVR